MDFYDFVKPLDYEDYVRTRLVEDLSSKVRDQFQGASVQSFGSFPAKLYLPTADMDLVFVSDDYMNGGYGRYSSNNFLRRFKQFLLDFDLVLKGSIEVITGAKVPLVKYRDKITGLKVDISFENDTGLIANKTFQYWKTQYPAMPILVTVIKHLLAMRGLNEPFNGGIGGFSITCLVVSLLQNMPQVQSRSMIPEHHLGEVLMEFLDLYGNQFNVSTTSIQLNPPGYVPKVSPSYPPRSPPTDTRRPKHSLEPRILLGNSQSLTQTCLTMISLADPKLRLLFGGAFLCLILRCRSEWTRCKMPLKIPKGPKVFSAASWAAITLPSCFSVPI